MKILGNSARNKWCAFCKYWYDPSCIALEPKAGIGMYMVNCDIRCKCAKKNLITNAISTCNKFTPKL